MFVVAYKKELCGILHWGLPVGNLIDYVKFKNALFCAVGTRLSLGTYGVRK